MKKRDIIIIGIVLLVALLSLFLIKTLGNTSDSLDVVIMVGSDEYKRIPFTDETDETIKVESPNGYNIVVIKDGEVRVTDADCPDLNCVYNMPVDDPTDFPIMCIPHGVVVKIVPKGEQ